MTSFLELLGKEDNLGEPTPALNNKPVMLGVVISFLVLALLCAILRIWCRFYVVRAAGWDDFFVTLVMISISVGSIGTCVATDYGLGEHLILMSTQRLSEYLRVFYICNTTLPMSTTFIKIAILLQYLRTFEKGTKSRTVTIVVLIITAMWGFAYMFLACIPAIPVKAYWDWNVDARGRWGFGSHTAEELIRTYESHAASNMVLDFIIFAIPLPLYFSSEANKKSRKSVLGLFLLGSVVLMLSAWRLANLIDSRAGTYPTLDVTWYAPTPMALAILEIDIAAICASLPVFWPVLQSGMGSIFVTHEVAITTETLECPRCSEDLEMAGGSLSCSQPSTTLETDALVEPQIFGAYMMGKTTSAAAATKAV
ncbi:hypothetical protein CCHL11_02548 [Colletotrichum chlorophyti]|uniref:Rhodopsin domain-containing protein n=1 Tax=Colletotrichum chlorophyti TaxID=708187 RepID=A0A1Q8S925_9PEZI|nr:hypothetical protein CCHL11_02548 [Colletotrichum chlorophyti]